MKNIKQCKKKRRLETSGLSVEVYEYFKTKSPDIKNINCVLSVNLLRIDRKGLNGTLKDKQGSEKAI